MNVFFIELHHATTTVATVDKLFELPSYVKILSLPLRRRILRVYPSARVHLCTTTETTIGKSFQLAWSCYTKSLSPISKHEFILPPRFTLILPWRWLSVNYSKIPQEDIRICSIKTLVSTSENEGVHPRFIVLVRFITLPSLPSNSLSPVYQSYENTLRDI